jgi:hypothetical protein
MCRKCRAQPETLGHILGPCTSTKSQRIRRHDEIKDLILDKVNKTVADATITRKPTIELPNGGKLKPDMVIKNHEGVFVVDVTVRHEDGDYLAKGRLIKREKYAPLLPILRERVATTSAEVLPVVPAESVEALRRIGIKDRKTLLTISLIALRSSIELYHAFMDYDRAPNAGVAPPKNVK